MSPRRFAVLLTVGSVAVAVVVGFALRDPSIGLAAGAGILALGGVWHSAMGAERDQADIHVAADDQDGTLAVRVANHGRRPIKIEAVGFADTRTDSTATHFRYWISLVRPFPIPGTLAETESFVVFIRHGLNKAPRTARWIFAEDSLGERHWAALPATWIELQERPPSPAV